MSKSDKELAVDLTLKTLDMITNQKLGNGNPTIKAPGATEINNLLQSFHKTLKNLDS